MHLHATPLLSLLFAFGAAAQTPEEALPAPPVLSAEASEASPAGCGVCAAGAQCVEGRCQFVCQTNGDCRHGLICVRSGAVGHCESKTFQRPGSPPTIRRADATHPERYKFSSLVPEGFHLVSEPLWGIAGYGVLGFALGYLPYAIGGLARRTPLDLIPLAGAILSYRRVTGVGFGLDPFIEFFEVVGIVLSEVVQAAGLAAVIAAVAFPSQWLERDDGKPALSLVPGAAGAPLGASLVGRF